MVTPRPTRPGSSPCFTTCPKARTRCGALAPMPRACPISTSRRTRSPTCWPPAAAGSRAITLPWCAAMPNCRRSGCRDCSPRWRAPTCWRRVRSTISMPIARPCGPARAPAGADPDASSPLGELRTAMTTAHAATPPATRHGVDGKPVLLHVLHGWGGGAERFVRDLAAADDDHAHLVLIARGHFSRRRYGEVLELHDGALDGIALRRLALPRPIAATAYADTDYRAFFDDVLCDFGVGAVLLSSLIGHS